MPEGDTVHRLARVLARELTGRRAERVELSDHGELPDLAGRRIDRVEALGKHLLVHLDGGWSLRVHLGMHGRWRRLDPGAPRAGKGTLVLVAAGTTYVCERAYRADAVRTSAVRAHPRLARLGPDLLSEPPPVDEAVARARLPAHAGREVGDLLLDQRVAAGIGNIYRSEILFECGLNPRTAVGALTAEDLRRVYTTAARLLRLHLTRRSPEPVRPGRGPRLRVYMRAGRPCTRCGAAIERFLQGDTARSTYFCPGCQPPRA